MSVMPSLDVLAPLEEEALLLPILQKLEKREFTLPPLPQIANKVLALTQDSDANAAQLSMLIQQDPILTSKIFQTTNSPLYSSMRHIESIQQAIAWLGLNQISGIALSFAMQETFTVQGYENEVRELWKHSVLVGLFAKAIAGQMGKDRETVFLCGLLHAIGKPFIVHTINQGRQEADPPISWTAMLSLIKQSYVEVGRHLADAWHFPDSVKETIMLHRDHTFHLCSSSLKGAAVTCLANHLADCCLDPTPSKEEALHTLPVTQYLSSFPVNLNTLLEMKETMVSQVDRMLV